MVNYSIMGKLQTVKARSRQGADSLDLTIPVKICRDSNIHASDVFTIEKIEENGYLILKYVKIYPTG